MATTVVQIPVRGRTVGMVSKDTTIVRWAEGCYQGYYCGSHYHGDHVSPRYLSCIRAIWC